VPDIDAPGTVIYFSNQTEVIALDVEDCRSSDTVGRWEILTNVLLAFPFRPFGQSIPDIQRSGEFRVFGAGFNQLSAGNDVQGKTPHIQNVRKKRNCQIDAEGRSAIYSSILRAATNSS